VLVLAPPAPRVKAVDDVETVEDVDVEAADPDEVDE
jgi:hypothetical protein